MVDSPPSATPGKISVTSWNILAPVWACPAFYPSCSVPHLNKDVRRGLIAKHCREIDSDVFLMQEVEEEELDKLRQENTDLDSRYALQVSLQ